MFIQCLVCTLKGSIKICLFAGIHLSLLIPESSSSTCSRLQPQAHSTRCEFCLADMQSFCRSLRGVKSHLTGSKIIQSQSSKGYLVNSVPREPNVSIVESSMLSSFLRQPNDKGTSCSSATPRTGFSFLTESSTSMFHKSFGSDLSKWGRVGPAFSSRPMTTMGDSEEPAIAPRIKFKRLDKTAKHIMQILDKEAVEGVREKREILDIKPGYIIQLKVEVPENKRRVSIVKGIVIARRNCGLNTTFRLRRLVAGVGVESVFPLYSPNIKEMKILDKKKVRRAKLYYLRDKMNALKKH